MTGGGKSAGHALPWKSKGEQLGSKQTWGSKGHRAFFPSQKHLGVSASCPALGQDCGLGLTGVPRLQGAGGLNKPLDPRSLHKTDRPGEVTLITPLNLVFSPCCNSLAEYAHFFLEIS